MKLSFRWRTTKHPKPNKELLAKAMQVASQAAGLPAEPEWELSVDFVGDRAMALANQDYVGHQGTTDVITFSYFDADAPIFDGDVAIELFICTDVAAREGSERADSSYAHELMLYLVHGLLHSAGEDDLTEVAALSMRKRESEVLAVLLQEFNFSDIFAE